MYLVYGSSTLNKSTIVSKNQTLIIIYRSWIFGFIFCSFTKTSIFINTYIIRFWIRIIVFCVANLDCHSACSMICCNDDTVSVSNQQPKNSILQIIENMNLLYETFRVSIISMLKLIKLSYGWFNSITPNHEIFVDFCD